MTTSHENGEGWSGHDTCMSTEQNKRCVNQEKAHAQLWHRRLAQRLLGRCAGMRLFQWRSRLVVVVVAAGTRRLSRKQYPKPCTELLSSTYPAFLAPFANDNGKGSTSGIFATYWSRQRGSGRDFAVVVSKIYQDMPFLKLRRRHFHLRKTIPRPSWRS